MNDSLWTFVFEVANFVVLAALLAWLLFKPVRKALEDQRAKVGRIEEEATKKLADAERIRQEIESQHEQLATELDARRTKAREVAKLEAGQIVAEAREHIERERARLRHEALHIEQAQTAKIAQAVAITTRSAMQRFLEQLDGPELEQTLIKAACGQLRTFSNGSLAPVTIESAIPIDGDSRHLIASALGDAAKTADFRVVPELKGGLRISTAHGLIDASLSGLANYAEQSLSAELESIMRENSEGE